MASVVTVQVNSLEEQVWLTYVPCLIKKILASKLQISFQALSGRCCSHFCTQPAVILVSANVVINVCYV